jgi:hypothetical protein
MVSLVLDLRRSDLLCRTRTTQYARTVDDMDAFVVKRPRESDRDEPSDEPASAEKKQVHASNDKAVAAKPIKPAEHEYVGRGERLRHERVAQDRARAPRQERPGARAPLIETADADRLFAVSPRRPQRSTRPLFSSASLSFGRASLSSRELVLCGRHVRGRRTPSSRTRPVSVSTTHRTKTATRWTWASIGPMAEKFCVPSSVC